MVFLPSALSSAIASLVHRLKDSSLAGNCARSVVFVRRCMWSRFDGKCLEQSGEIRYEYSLTGMSVVLSLFGDEREVFLQLLQLFLELSMCCESRLVFALRIDCCLMLVVVRTLDRVSSTLLRLCIGHR